MEDSETSALPRVKSRVSPANTTSDDVVHVATPAEFVRRFGGNRVIERVLIANNGISAVKFMRSIRLWAYEMFGNEKAIRFDVMVTPEDLKANAEYIRMADQYVHVPGGSNNHNYANIDLILDVAKRTGAQAVWAGWGHASENPKLPELLQKHGITFMGPPERAMWALGDKIASTIMAQSADVPTLPWSGSGLIIGNANERLASGKTVEIPEDLYKRGFITSSAAGLKIATDIGFPVMIKASEGGGGKGIRKVQSAQEFQTAFEQVQTEVPGSPIFIMKLATKARHLEVQVLADQHGNAISLFGRDCSVQRRHQKIIEEAPTTVVSQSMFDEMAKAAVRLTKMVGYVSAGTVEYLYVDGEGFYFLEFNPRLQVEHPCTEIIADVNLPAAQFQVAMGIPLHRIKDIRVLYHAGSWNTTPIDFEKPSHKPEPHGHVIAARITAENPDEGFKPSGGTVQELTFRSSKNVWGYFSVSASGGLHEYADSQFGHCFAWGEDREKARMNLVLALNQVSIRGDFRTTVEYLIKLLEADEFISNDISTVWLDKLIAGRVQSEKPDIMVAVVAASLHVADSTFQKRFSQYEHSLARGQVMSAAPLTSGIDVDLIYENMKYVVQVYQCALEGYFVLLNNSWIKLEVHRMSDGGLLFSIAGNSYSTYMKEEVDQYRIIIGGKTCIFGKECDPSILRSPSAGKLIRYLVDDGGHVFAGDAYAEIEVMKAVMSLTVSENGCIHCVKHAGAILDSGTVIAHLELDDPSRIRQAVKFEGQLPFAQHSFLTEGARLHEMFASSHAILENILKGYCVPDPFFNQKLEETSSALMRALLDPNLPLIEMQEILSTLTGRIPVKIERTIQKLLSQYSSNVTSMLCQFPGRQIENMIDTYAQDVGRTENNAFFMNMMGVIKLIQRYREGIRGHMKNVLLSFFKEYLRVESAFNHGNYDVCVARLRDSHKDDMAAVVGFVLSHQQVARKNALIVNLISRYCAHQSAWSDDVLFVLQELASLNNQKNAKVALKARQVMIESSQPSFEVRYNEVESVFLLCLHSPDASDQLQKLIQSESSLFDVLPSFFYHINAGVCRMALEVYVRRAYIAYEMVCLNHGQVDGLPIVEWQFMLPQSHPNRRPQPSRKLKKHSIPQVFSIGDKLSDLPGIPQCERMGVMVACETLEDFEKRFENILCRFRDSLSLPGTPISGTARLPSVEEGKPQDDVDDPRHIINVALKSFQSTETDTLPPTPLLAFIDKWRDYMRTKSLRRISFLLHSRGVCPQYYTFRSSTNFGEDAIYRHMEPALAFQLEINRMSNFDLQVIPSLNPRMHLYLGSAKMPKGQKSTDLRLFIRSIIRHSDFISKEATIEYMVEEGERCLLEALDELEVYCNNPEFKSTDCNHIFLNYVPPFIVPDINKENVIFPIILRHGRRLWNLRVMQAEIKLCLRSVPNGPNIPVRFFITNSSGYNLELHVYQEVEDPLTGELVLRSYGPKTGPMHGQKINAPFVPKDYVEMKRSAAHALQTTYVYDYLNLFQQAVEKQWRKHAKALGQQENIPEQVMSATELVLADQKTLKEVNRSPGQNDVGVVVWKAKMFTPECPNGREILLIANDVTYKIGSFGPQEDQLFNRASEMARSLGIPRIHIAVNSGARIGLAEEVKQLFQVAWVDNADPNKGIKYLYLNPVDFTQLSHSVKAELIEDEGESRYKITDIIGEEEGLGVENLQGSGMIARETSLAYNEIVTLSLVSCRTIGIGAYLVRLGQRIVQVENSNIILTGAGALNKVLGKQVYSSNNQLGGPRIMHYNGVTHLAVGDDLAGVQAIVHWLSYIPAVRNAPLPLLPTSDPVERTVDFMPTKVPYDPRCMLEGRPNPDNSSKWQSGLFDKGSFVETMKPWAQSVICGRARLGGIPVGVIAVETRSVECVVPADPANVDSEAQIVTQAGLVWYPDSAFKTAQAISDFNMEQLPLIIFANWRGFSGGMRDMYQEVLKYGALIVDALRQYKQPVIIYIPPNGELRGGAWVVLDSTINPEMIEMYADKDSRGGVLEPEGTVEVKYKTRDLVKTMDRLDPECRRIGNALGNSGILEADQNTLQHELEQRHKHLEPTYHQVAVQFADLHDTAGRMQDKGVILDILDWRNSRGYLYWRLKRRLLEQEVVKKVIDANSTLSHGQTMSMLKRWFIEQHGVVKNYLWDDNKTVVGWLSQQLSDNAATSVIEQNTKFVKRDHVLKQIKSLVQANPEVAMDSIIHITHHMSPNQRMELARVLSSLDAHPEPVSTLTDSP
ncbi:acetyl-CoA carboxylase-like [Corticium candelabrum]|uniref:acetyl-CoA carboxylase-like n=1 Tax=Corticium candelabrum TaxID=121492 RepID=UPI002E275023|nr:acetyl-CoA carboxylase-like [Corticium candelabrum]